MTTPVVCWAIMTISTAGYNQVLLPLKKKEYLSLMALNMDSARVDARPIPRLAAAYRLVNWVLIKALSTDAVIGQFLEDPDPSITITQHEMLPTLHNTALRSGKMASFSDEDMAFLEKSRPLETMSVRSLLLSLAVELGLTIRDGPQDSVVFQAAKPSSLQWIRDGGNAYPFKELTATPAARLLVLRVFLNLHQ